MVYFKAFTYVSALSLLFLGHCLEATYLIHHACKKAAEIDPNFNYHFCVAHLEQNPKSQHATQLEELGVISIEIAMSKATHISSHIKELLRNGRLDSYAKSCLKDCLDLYSDAFFALKVATGDFKSRDYDQANLQVSSAMEASTTCEDEFGDKKGEVSPLTKENSLYFQLTAISLAFTKICQ